MLVLTAVRHGESTLNAAGLLTGRLDPPLTAAGRAQAAALAAVAARPFDVRLHSGARRAADTLRIACDAAGLPDVTLRSDPRWQERSFGELEGAPSAAWAQRPGVDDTPPGGESYRALGLRVFVALDELAIEGEAAGAAPFRVLLCAHSGVLRMLRGIADGAGHLDTLLGPGAVNGAVVELLYEARPAAPPFLTAARRT
ncbi:MAG TPA: histidine phosphatase family protein [Baekduia sp.]